MQTRAPPPHKNGNLRRALKIRPPGTAVAGALRRPGSDLGLVRPPTFVSLSFRAGHTLVKASLICFELHVFSTTQGRRRERSDTPRIGGERLSGAAPAVDGHRCASAPTSEASAPAPVGRVGRGAGALGGRGAKKQRHGLGRGALQNFALNLHNLQHYGRIRTRMDEECTIMVPLDWSPSLNIFSKQRVYVTKYESTRSFYNY